MITLSHIQRRDEVAANLREWNQRAPLPSRVLLFLHDHDRNLNLLYHKQNPYVLSHYLSHYYLPQRVEISRAAHVMPRIDLQT